MRNTIQDGSKDRCFGAEISVQNFVSRLNSKFNTIKNWPPSRYTILNGFVRFLKFNKLIHKHDVDRWNGPKAFQVSRCIFLVKPTECQKQNLVPREGVCNINGILLSNTHWSNCTPHTLHNNIGEVWIWTRVWHMNLILSCNQQVTAGRDSTSWTSKNRNLFVVSSKCSNVIMYPF